MPIHKQFGDGCHTLSAGNTNSSNDNMINRLCWPLQTMIQIPFDRRRNRANNDRFAIDTKELHRVTVNRLTGNSATACLVSVCLSGCRCRSSVWAQQRIKDPLFFLLPPLLLRPALLYSMLLGRPSFLSSLGFASEICREICLNRRRLYSTLSLSYPPFFSSSSSGSAIDSWA